MLKNSSKLEVEQKEMKTSFESGEMEKIEGSLIKDYNKENPSSFNDKIIGLMEALSLEKQEGEKNDIFQSRLLSGVGKILDIEL